MNNNERHEKTMINNAKQGKQQWKIMTNNEKQSRHETTMKNNDK
jgi:hypothetical protein